MSVLDKNRYLQLRREFQPGEVRLAIVAESPPASGLYFYNPSGRVGEPLFAALMKQLGLPPTDKLTGLREFQRRGCILVDATYQPVNRLSKSERDLIITRDYPALRDDLKLLMDDRPAPIVLIKANVCRLLEPKLVQDGFDVLNQGRLVFFPSHGRQGDFRRQFDEILGRSPYE